MKYRLLIWYFVVVNPPAFSQGSLILSTKDSQLFVKGTSTLHDWQCRAEQLSSQFVAEIGEGNIKQIRSFVLNVPVNSIRSITEQGAYYDKGMDKNIYKALKADKNPNITFTFSRIVKKNSNGKGLDMEIMGALRVAGVTKELTIIVRSIPISDGLLFEGKVPLKMTDYKVEPPTAIFGTIKTGNEVMVEFKMAYLLQPRP
jgi:hypothetical protein